MRIFDRGRREHNGEGGGNRAGDCVAVVGPLPHARNHFVITTGFVATKVAVTNTKCYGVDLLANLKPKGRS